MGLLSLHFFFSRALKCKVIKMWIVTKLPYSSSLKCFHIIKASWDIQQLNTLCFLETTDFKLLQQILSDLFAMKAKTNVQVAELLARSSPKGSAKVGNIEDSGMFNLPRKVCRRNPRSSPGKEEKQDKQMPLLIYWVSFSSLVKWNNPLAHLVVLRAPKLTSTTHSQIPKPQALFSLGPSQLLQLKEKPCTAELK